MTGFDDVPNKVTPTHRGQEDVKEEGTHQNSGGFDDLPDYGQWVAGEPLPIDEKQVDDDFEDGYGWLRTAAVYVAGFAIALFAFGIWTQALYYCNAVASLSVPLQWLFGISGTLCAVVFIIVFIKILRLWFSFEQNKISTLLKDRKNWRENAADDIDRKRKARDQYLLPYLKGFTLEKNVPLKKGFYSNKGQLSDRQILKKLGMSEKELDKLRQAQIALVESTDSSTDWIKNFQSDFQKPLDDLAKKRVSAYFYKVFYGTAISPRNIVDQAIVTLALSAMVHDLLRIYRLKPAPGQTIFLLAHAFFNVYAAGNMQEVTEKGVNYAGNTFDAAGGNEAIADWGSNAVVKAADMVKASDEFKAVATDGFIKAIPFVGKAIGAVTAKIAEGAINAFLLRNLGRQIIAWIQPTRPKK